MLSSVGDRVMEQLRMAGVTEVLPDDDLYPGDERIGATLARVRRDALDRLASRS